MLRSSISTSRKGGPHCLRWWQISKWMKTSKHAVGIFWGHGRLVGDCQLRQARRLLNFRAVANKAGKYSGTISEQELCKACMNRNFTCDWHNFHWGCVDAWQHCYKTHVSSTTLKQACQLHKTHWGGKHSCCCWRSPLPKLCTNSLPSQYKNSTFRSCPLVNNSWLQSTEVVSTNSTNRLDSDAALICTREAVVP